MQSSRKRYNHIQPSSPMDMLMASTEAGMASMRRKLNEVKEEERLAQGICSFCNKEGCGSLKSCSRCKAARYCNQTCQLADFKARHKRECAGFAHPPTTSAFLTQPVAGEKYAQHPVFAHWHEDGVGCWASISGRIDCDLQSFVDAIDPLEHRDRQERLMVQGGEPSRTKIRLYKAAARSLVGLRVLVQNRRKDKDPILLFASRAQVVSRAALTDAVLRGAAKGDNHVRFAQDKSSRVAVGVATDPWDNVPRLTVTSVNGIEVKKGTQPAQIKNAEEGIVALRTGDFAILHLQFRVGDGDAISKDWEAFHCLESIVLPWASWDGTTPPASLIPSLPTAQSPPVPTPTPAQGGSTAQTPSAHALRAPFDQRAVRTYYADFIERGEEAYMRSHYGDARTDMARGAEQMMEMMGEMLLGHVAQAGNTDVLVRRLRESGMGDLADKIAAR
ncbi:hypothetical protein C8Q78DRAFT_1168540 [Trametes maxima]|nr:hypothetical protein C8Q78DRAFT_1168540 [Trametes maxima]